MTMIMLGNVKRGVRKVKRWARGGGGGPRFRRPVPASVSRFVFFFLYIFGGKKTARKKLSTPREKIVINNNEMAVLFTAVLFTRGKKKKGGHLERSFRDRVRRGVRRQLVDLWHHLYFTP